MWRHWMNDLINMLAGHSRYVQYPVSIQWFVLLAIVGFLLIPFLLDWFA